MLVYVLFYLGQLSHFPSCCGAGVTNLNEPPSSFLFPPHYCGLGAGSIPFRAIVNYKQCETRGLFMSLVIHYWIGDVQDCQGVSASEMTCIVSSGALNSTHSLTRKCRGCQLLSRFKKALHSDRAPHWQLELNSAEMSHCQLNRPKILKSILLTL